MPISYSIDLGRKVIFEVWTGGISAADLELYWMKYLEDQQVLSVRRTLVDLRMADILFRGDVFADLIVKIVQPILAGRDWKTAILVERPVQFGLSRQYQVFAETFSRDSIFHDYDTALQWLMQQELEA
ncbi:MAG TPA: hypothetical protein VGM64_09255 [Lacunisphaera sp.]|jgi:hypothetical protein